MSDLIQASSRDIDGPLLELKDVTTHFKTARGLVRAVGVGRGLAAVALRALHPILR